MECKNYWEKREDETQKLAVIFTDLCKQVYVM